MPHENLLSFLELRVFEDETLREAAYGAVNTYFQDNPDPKKRTKNTQLHSIPEVIHALGLSGLQRLAKNQSDKNTSEVNKIFWQFVRRLLESPTDNLSIHYLVNQEAERQIQGLSEKGETGLSDRQFKKLRQELLEKVLPIYFEHFLCHYFYRKSQE